MSYEPHPFALLFPAMDADAFSYFVASVREGLQNPIVLYQGKVLDGVQRQKACSLAGVEPHYIQFLELPEAIRKRGPLTYVVAQNLHRRHMDASQKALAAAKIANMPQGRPQKGADLHLISVSQAAHTFNVSSRSVKAATKLIRVAPEKVAAVEKGEISVTKALRQLKPTRNKPMQQQKQRRQHMSLSKDVATATGKTCESQVIGVIHMIERLDREPFKGFCERMIGHSTAMSERCEKLKGGN